MSKSRWKKLAQDHEWIAKALESMDEATREDSFYKSLEFGTGGMRGLLGIGPNRMNVYTVAKASVGYGRYLLDNFDDPNPKVAIAYDNRHMSKEFSEVSARILSSLGIQPFVFTQPRPTPQLSFALRELGCVGGIVITASHNPKEYNGYKIYDETGAQLVDDKIAGVIALIDAIEDETAVDLEADMKKEIVWLAEDMDQRYKAALKSVQLLPDADKTVKIVFSSQHGTSFPLVPDVLKETGYDVVVVKEQSDYDPDFTNTLTPNPEERDSYQLAVEYAKDHKAQLVLCCDPDADRMGVVVLHQGDYHYLSGNQTGAVLQEYIYKTRRENKTLPGNAIMFNTVVTSDLGGKIAQAYGVHQEQTLTGFKYIGEKIEEHNQRGDYQFVFGYEESYGYLLADFARDKDAPQACLIVSEAVNYYASHNKTLVDVLQELYRKHGAYHETQVSLTLAGREGLARIQNILRTFRDNPLTSIGGLDVEYTDDYSLSKRSDGTVLAYPVSNVLKYYLADGSWIAIRPSGTEPKCKFYYCVRDISVDLAVKKAELLKQVISDLVEQIQ